MNANTSWAYLGAKCESYAKVQPQNKTRAGDCPSQKCQQNEIMSTKPLLHENHRVHF